MPLHSSSDDLYHQALDRLAEGDPAGAAEQFRQCLAIDPTLINARHGLVRALQDAGQLDQALAEAHHLIQLDPDDVLAHTSLSILYQHKGMIPEAEAEALKGKLLSWKLHLKQAKS